MTFALRLLPAAPLAAALALATVPAGAEERRAFPDHPPVGHTGGFGEPTCAQCHTGAALNESGGSLSLRGVPESYAPGQRYRVLVRLRREGMESGGFQLAARCGDGRQAGELAPADTARVRIAANAKNGVRYAHQTRAGTVPAAPGSIEWPVEWTAPARECGAVRFDAAANAANYDDSALGDYVYTASRAAGPSGSR